MTHAAFFAPIIRGTIINLVQKPWIVQSAGSAQSIQKERKASLRIAFLKTGGLSQKNKKETYWLVALGFLWGAY